MEENGELAGIDETVRHGLKPWNKLRLQHLDLDGTLASTPTKFSGGPEGVSPTIHTS